MKRDIFGSPDSTLILKRDVVAFVVGLFGAGCPSAICRLVVAIVVVPFYRMFGTRTWPHINKKVFKLRPLRADCNTTSTVTSIRTIVGIKASLSDANPYLKFGCFTESVLKAGFCHTRLAGTAARLGFASHKVVGIYRLLSSAGTPTQPIMGIKPIQQRQKIELLAGVKPITERRSKHTVSLPQMAVAT